MKGDIVKLEKIATSELLKMRDDANEKIKKLEADIVKYHSAMFVWYCMSQIKICEKKITIITDELRERVCDID